jgi:hypothetical protein
VVFFLYMSADIQEGPKCVAAYLTKERVTESFKVVLVGPEGQTDFLKERAMKLPSLHVDTKRIFNFLAVRHGLGVDMQSSSWAVPGLSHLDLVFNGLIEHLVNSARRVTSEAELAVACMVGNDVAHVVTQMTMSLTYHRGVLSVSGVGGTAALNEAIRICLQGVLQTVRPTFPTNATADNGGLGFRV